MTFEARDSAAKVTPARFKLNNNHGSGGGSAAHSRKASPVPGGAVAAGAHAAVARTDSRRSAGCQTRFPAEAHPALFRTASGGPAAPSPAGSEALSRSALTAAFLNFSRALHHKQLSVESSSSHRRLASSPVAAPLAKSPSAPDLPLAGRVAWSPAGRRPAALRGAAAAAAGGGDVGATPTPRARRRRLAAASGRAQPRELARAARGSPAGGGMGVAAGAGRRRRRGGQRGGAPRHGRAAAPCCRLSLLPRQALSVDCYSPRRRPPRTPRRHALAAAAGLLEPSRASGSRRGSQCARGAPPSAHQFTRHDLTHM
ncbi:AAEL005128-PA [Gryllus bimaculatus]|nr:AAEL005128-PA [Gryllus bimaculatus]